MMKTRMMKLIIAPMMNRDTVYGCYIHDFLI